jgi:ferredoxin
MRVRVDSDRCVGHGRCYDLAPEIFGEDEQGHCRIRRARVPAELEAKARSAAGNCPEDAIRIVEEP